MTVLKEVGIPARNKTLKHLDYGDIFLEIPFIR